MVAVNVTQFGVDDGVDIDYRLTGPAGSPTVVLIHGGLIHSVAWERQVPFLAGRWQVLTYDVRGYGASGRPTHSASYSVERSAADAGQLLVGLGLGPAHLVGFSQGGMIALRLAADRPELVRSLTLVSSTARLTREQAAVFEARASKVESAGLEDEVRTHIQRAFSARFVELNRELIASFERMVAANDRIAVAATLRALANTDLRPALASIRCPTLVLAGSQDAGMPPAVHAAGLFAGIAGARVDVLPGVGHTIPVEDPDGVNRRLLAFFDEVDGKPVSVVA
jgi:3-oxoadipate enol-lactonase